MAKLLLVEDEPRLAASLQRGLRSEGHLVEVRHDGDRGLLATRHASWDLLILDWMLPERSGVDVCRHLRADGCATPILMLTARDATSDVVAGLDAGADDYLVKPFDFEELLARIEALLRRTRQQAQAQHELLKYADLTVDLTSHVTRRGTRLVHLTAREFELLVLFLRHPDQVLQRTIIMNRIWGDDFYGDSNVLEVFVGNLRRALEAAGEPRLIQTVRGVGYVLREQPGTP
ncbi:MAG: response regulator transcription factor [Thermomicrobiales bacterium]|nr:response regulator transcription factor [Thermomicrobiales bacterium]